MPDWPISAEQLPENRFRRVGIVAQVHRTQKASSND
jgi:hypothetical protein